MNDTYPAKLNPSGFVSAVLLQSGLFGWTVLTVVVAFEQTHEGLLEWIPPTRAYRCPQIGDVS